MDPKHLVSSAALALLAGFVDGFAFVMLGGFFVSFMSGNTTQASAELTGGAWGAAAYAGLLVAAFVVGGVTGTAVSIRARSRGVMTLVAAMLLAAAALAGLGVVLAAGPVLAAAMGATNAVHSRDGAAPFGITYMTGQLMKLAENIVAAFRGGDRRAWMRHLALWLAIAIGAVGGAAAARLVGPVALWLPAAAAGATAITLFLRRRRPSSAAVAPHRSDA
ncbi:uncharacterized membrane protein YoaK (UPF0700 family) [Microbacterium sp. SORGH_AS428]|uniref:YoaK family protein n=1 Tax=Microbacterium sp. SORGH_AS_0428 TaxID=3041788 RepID=UPI0028648AAF|nr:DUF1275 family protein [Microbacterium sp. SORGH_AS_0428]MDR6199421.1 uncharacterized membrane protein YoaK (UPF0700 family) [Microbacterium sp. SORGH_AS_0428]